MPKETFKYDNGELQVTWVPKKCIHSKLCWTQLGAVFNPSLRPWITMSGAESKDILAQVNRCPSGALQAAYLSEIKDDNTEPPALVDKGVEVTVAVNGPLLIKGPCSVMVDGQVVHQGQGNLALCRCGASANKPFCDGAHSRIQFRG